MEMCYDGALVMPTSYAVMDEDEMRYLKGGVNIYMYKELLDKQHCIALSQSIQRLYGYYNISVMDIAKELYGHAYVYYKLPILNKIPVKSVNSIYKSAANGADIGNARDSRAWAFDIIWGV